MEESLSVDFLGDGVVNDVTGLDSFVVRADPRIDPERSGSHDFLLFVSHGAGDVHHSQGQRAAFRALLGFPGKKAFVFVNRHDTRVVCVVGPRCDLPSQRLAISSFEVAKGFGSAARHLGVLVSYGADPVRAFWLYAGKLELLSEVLRELFHREVHLEDMGAGRITGVARPTQFAFALAHATLGCAEAEAWQFDLRNGDANEVFPFLADQFAVRDVLFQVLLNTTSYDFPKAKMILFDVKDHKGSPNPSRSVHNYAIELRNVTVILRQPHSLASPRAKMLAT